MLRVKALRKAKHLRNSIPHAQDLALCMAPILRVKALKLIPAL